MIAVAALTVWAGWARDEQGRWVEHTLEVQRAISQIEAAVISAESSNRGYIIVGDDVYLQPYQQAITALPGALAKLEAMIADNPEQFASLATLKAAITERMSRLAKGIDLRRTQGYEAASAFIQTHSGRALMQEFRQILAGMKAREAQLLSQRQAAASRADWYMALFSGAATAIAALFSAVWIATARRFTRQLQETIAEREAAEAQVRQMQKMEAVGQLTGGIAHDFNNMLAVIISALNLMKKRMAKGDMDVMKFVDAAIDGSNRAATLTKRLTAFSRQSTLEPQPINCNKFVAGMSNLIERTLGATVKVETVLAGGLWLTNVDPSQLENALLNLAVNARDAMPEGGKITIETSNAYLDERYASANAMLAGQYVMVALSDSGTGMAPDVATRAFDPFFTTKGVGKGTGLGLSQVHGFVRQSGGHVKIYSEPGQGTTVKIYLPRYYGSEERHEVEPARKMREGHDPAQHVILVVEDDDQVRMATTALVRELGYRVVEAANAKDALAILNGRSDISLLFTDIVMPEINGRKLADDAVKLRPGLKVLFTTGFTRNAIVHHGVLDPGVEYIPKPFTLNELAHKLEPLIITAEAQASD